MRNYELPDGRSPDGTGLRGIYIHRCDPLHRLVAQGDRERLEGIHQDRPTGIGLTILDRETRALPAGDEPSRRLRRRRCAGGLDGGAVRSRISGVHIKNRASAGQELWSKPASTSIRSDESRRAPKAAKT